MINYKNVKNIDKIVKNKNIKKFEIRKLNSSSKIWAKPTKKVRNVNNGNKIVKNEKVECHGVKFLFHLWSHIKCFFRLFTR